jgi:subtilisin family serine protease
LPACGNSNSTPALNAQNAGAIAAIQIYNTSPVPLPDVAGTNAAVTIPYIRVSQADGLTLKANLAAGVNVTLYNGGDQLASFSSRGPRGSSVVRLKPDIAAPGVNIFSAETGNSCTTASNAGCIFPSLTGFNPGSLAASLSGTSMAAPQVTGLTALMRQIHPDWSTEEIKALLMNTASHAVTQFPAGNGQPWTPPRIGSGRPDPPTAAQSSSLAFNAEGNGSVSVSFGDDFATSATRTGKVRVENKGASAVTYDLAIVPAIDAPGLSYSLPGGSLLTVLAGASQTIDVRLNANPTLMQHARDATMPPTEVDMASLGTLNKQFVTEQLPQLA